MCYSAVEGGGVLGPGVKVFPPLGTLLSSHWGSTSQAKDHSLGGPGWALASMGKGETQCRGQGEG